MQRFQHMHKHVLFFVANHGFERYFQVLYTSLPPDMIQEEFPQDAFDPAVCHEVRLAGRLRPPTLLEYN